MRKDSGLFIMLTVVLTIFCVLAIGTQARAAFDPVLLLHFDEGFGTTAVDSSGYGNNGAISGGAAWTAGKFGSALTFNGSNASVLVSTLTNASQIQNAYSLSFWVKTTWSASGSNFLFGGSAEGTKHSGSTQVDGTADGPSYAGKIGSESNGGGAYIWSSTKVNDGQWHYVAFTISDNGSNITNRKVYIDGILSNSNNLSMPIETWATQHTIGSRTTQYFSGSIDEFSIYSRELSAQEISALYLAPAAPVPIPAAAWLFASGLAGLGVLRRKSFRA